VIIDGKKAKAACAEKVAAPLKLSEQDAAVGMIQLLEQNLLHAVEEISVKRGLNPARYTLIAAGGAGPMHGATVGRALGCKKVYVPRHAGAFCALGMLDSDIRHDAYKVFDAPLADAELAQLPKIFAGLSKAALDELKGEASGAEPVLRRVIDLVYKGQMRSVQVDYDPKADTLATLKGRFEDDHKRLYGHIKPITPIRFTALRVIATIPASPLAAPAYAKGNGAPTPSGKRQVFLDRRRGWQDIPVYDGGGLGAGHALQGPLIIEERTMTLFAGPDDHVTVDAAGNFLIELR
jgi:N-methylhydantoinase A